MSEPVVLVSQATKTDIYASINQFDAPFNEGETLALHSTIAFDTYISSYGSFQKRLCCCCFSLSARKFPERLLTN